MCASCGHSRTTSIRIATQEKSAVPTVEHPPPLGGAVTVTDLVALLLSESVTCTVSVTEAVPPAV